MITGIFDCKKIAIQLTWKAKRSQMFAFVQNTRQFPLTSIWDGRGGGVIVWDLVGTWGENKSKTFANFPTSKAKRFLT